MVAATGSAITHQRSPPKGRSSSAQPIGDSQVSQLRWWLPPESPTPRRKKTTAIAVIAIERAPRAVPLICAAIAATAANTSPQPASARPNANPPASGSPLAASTAAVSTRTTALATAATVSATASGACRPTTVEPMSSRRPVSSSPRVCLTTRKMLIRPAASAA